MAFEIRCDATLTERDEILVRAFLKRGSAIDFNDQFTFADGTGTAHTLAVAHFTEEPKIPAQHNAPYPWSASGFPIDPFITLEDLDGNLFGFQHCAPVTRTLQTNGILVRDAAAGELWLLASASPADITGKLTAGNILSGEYSPVRLHGVAESFSEEVGEIEAFDGLYEGVFVYSDEQRPQLVNAPIHEEIGSLQRHYGNKVLIAEDEDLICAVREMIRAEKEVLAGPMPG